ncbi:MAG: glutamate formimidoyltransferase [Chloroflexota bacterium]
MSHLVECVPNFSDGRHPDILAAIVSAIAAVPAVKVLDYSADVDHNRSVVTFVAPPETVVDAAFAGIATAAKLIDLDQHTGEHPRMGATDVCPFIPLEGVTLEQCVALAQTLGERVGQELHIPVYLYEAAATRPERQNLADVRRGGYETIKATIATDPAREPDYGPKQVGAAGAIAIGARDFLVAFNVFLTTSDVTIAKRIAKAIRHSSGGLRFVKAIGLDVDGKAQVSMNLTHYKRTPLHRVVEMIRREAARYGVGIASSELIGLIPQDALLDAAVWYLQLDEAVKDRVLESRL